MTTQEKRNAAYAAMQEKADALRAAKGRFESHAARFAETPGATFYLKMNDAALVLQDAYNELCEARSTVYSLDRALGER